MTSIGRAPDLDDSRAWSIAAARAAASKQAADVVILEVREVLAITDQFVIASASNVRQGRTIVEEVEAQLKAAGGPVPLRIEGLDDARWVLMDYGDFIVHVFLDEVRRFYDLERLWADAPRLTWAEEAARRFG